MQEVTWLLSWQTTVQNHLFYLFLCPNFQTHSCHYPFDHLEVETAENC